MSTADRIERERLAKRTRILDAARELFVERGIAAVTLREIAQRIEYSTTAIYVQFKDKQDLVDQMVREDFAAFANALHAAAANVADPIERLGRLGDAYVEYALTLPRHYQLLFMTPLDAASDAPEVHEPTGIDGYRVLLETVRECIAAGRFRAELRDADGIAQAIWATVHGVVSLLIVMGDTDAFHWRTPAVIADLALGSLVRGLLADPTAPQRPKRTARPAPRRR
ncbi:MAG: TetR/AcrR family transcriptional regulator [Deltaproteobacteria bacterium]|nr:TetR/AcrR family transcriptional regulator [Deltaproteobacteria bacterium]